MKTLVLLGLVVVILVGCSPAADAGTKEPPKEETAQPATSQ